MALLGGDSDSAGSVKRNPIFKPDTCFDYSNLLWPAINVARNVDRQSVKITQTSSNDDALEGRLERIDP